MYCKHCGKELADDAKFCPSCGGAISETVSGNKPATSPAVSVRQEKSEAEKKKPIIFGLFFAIIFLILTPLLPLFKFNTLGIDYWDVEELKGMELGKPFSASSFLKIIKKLMETEAKNSEKNEKYSNALTSLNVGNIIFGEF